MPATIEQQRTTALKKGNRKQAERRRLKQEVYEGELDVEVILLASPECLTTTGHRNAKVITVEDILSWPKGIHRRRMRQLCMSLQINPDAELHHLSLPRRERLVGALRAARSV